MLNVNLDDEAEKYLVEILAQEKTTSNEFRTYALYKITILCINVNTLFQAFVNHPWLVAIAKISLKNLDISLENYTCYFGFSVSLKIAPVRLAPLKLARSNLAPLKLMLVKLAPLKFGRFKQTTLKSLSPIA